MQALKHDIGYLDFVRGWAALIVFVHHAAILGGGPSLFIGSVGKEAVNAFMMASGFLIYFQCSIGRTYSKLQNTSGIYNFYVRRFFRIAPAYYVCLILSLVLASYLGECREAIAAVLPGTATSMDRYYIEDPIQNFFLHVSFIFGLLPSYSYSTPLPDWSLGLEMQFYLVFPIVFFLLRKRFLVFLFSILFFMFFVTYFSKKLGLHYPMPTFLPLMFHNFAAGIVIAHLLTNKNICFRYHFIYCSVIVLFLGVGNRSLFMPALFLFSWWWICWGARKDLLVITPMLKTIFEHKSSKFLSEMSYSVYILHLVLMLPFYSLIVQYSSDSLFFWAASVCSLFIVVLASSYLIYKYIEVPGIALGKKLVSKNSNREQIAVKASG
ncbi:acyltransferase family protein [Corallincola luteus]|nr:acyltransferase [Corallincola luteus]